MMKKLLIAALVLFLFTPNKGICQEYGDLLSLLVSEEYEKVIKKATKYTTDEKTKKDALPYLYYSEAMYRMSRDHKYNMDYPKAYKDALSYASKFRKKDKGNAYHDDAIDYIEELKLVIGEEVENYMAADDYKAYKKALGLMKKVIQFSPEDRGAQVTTALLEILTGNKSEGRKNLGVAWNAVLEIGSGDIQFEDMSEQTQFNLRFAIMKYANDVRKRDLAQAQTIISFGHQYFYGENEDYQKEYSEEYKVMYDDIN
ncbi:MAG: hypothetical protein ACI9J3_001483 [Parvicellaceae bacterium]|jgi:hypothetical protein